MSKAWEHTIANAIDDATSDEIRAYRIGFSGSSAKPNPDVLVKTPRDDYEIELKRSKNNRLYVDGEDLEQLVACENSYTTVWLVVKFNNREPVTIRYYGNMTGWTTSTEVSDQSDDESSTGNDDWNEMSIAERFAAITPECFDAHVTDGGNLRLDKPETDEWSSASAGLEDHMAILRDLGVKTENSITI
jgi:Holliday junction resolvase